MKCINIQEHGGISVGDTVNIIRDESEGYRCPICKGACKFKTSVTTDDGIKVKGKVKCQYCHGLGEVSVKRYKAHAVKIESIEHWEDDDIIMRTNTLYNVFLWILNLNHLKPRWLSVIKEIPMYMMCAVHIIYHQMLLTFPITHMLFSIIRKRSFSLTAMAK